MWLIMIDMFILKFSCEVWGITTFSGKYPGSRQNHEDSLESGITRNRHKLSMISARWFLKSETYRWSGSFAIHDQCNIMQSNPVVMPISPNGSPLSGHYDPICWWSDNLCMLFLTRPKSWLFTGDSNQIRLSFFSEIDITTVNQTKTTTFWTMSPCLTSKSLASTRVLDILTSSLSGWINLNNTI